MAQTAARQYLVPDISEEAVNFVERTLLESADRYSLSIMASSAACDTYPASRLKGLRLVRKRHGSESPAMGIKLPLLSGVILGVRQRPSETYKEAVFLDFSPIHQPDRTVVFMDLSVIVLQFSSASVLHRLKIDEAIVKTMRAESAELDRSR